MPSLKSLTVVSLILLTRAELPADEWSLSYRNWTYYDDWIIPPSCIDPSTCVKCNSSDETPNSGTIPCLGFNVTNGFTDVFQVWSVSDPYGPSPPSPRFVGVYTFFDGTGYQTARASSDDLVHFTQQLAPEGILYSPRTNWLSQPGEFDYGGAAFVGPLLTDYNVTAPRVLARAPASNRFWYAYFGQHLRGAMEPPPGATGLASSADGLVWTRETPQPILDTLPTHGAKPWEQTQVYAPFLVYDSATGDVMDVYNAQAAPASPWREQSGFAKLPGGQASLPGLSPLTNASEWVRNPSNPIIPNGPTGSFDAHFASDPKVFWDASLGDSGAWVMLYFGVGPSGHACICIAFSTDLVSWSKASTPLYTAGGHPKGLDRCHAHKAWLTADNMNRKFLYYTADSCSGRGIALLTSTPL